jgi:hypothetical protein
MEAKPDLQRFDRDVRYSACLSIWALAAQDIYTPIANTIHKANVNTASSFLTNGISPCLFRSGSAKSN